MLQPYPQADSSAIDKAAVDEMRWVMGTITAVRSIRSARDIAPSKLLPVLLADGSATQHGWLIRNEHYLKLLARMESLTWLEGGNATPESAMELVGGMKVLVPLGSFIDKQDELTRLKKEIEKFEKELTKANTKLGNADFVARAPAHVVEQEKTRIAEFEAALGKLRAQHSQVAALPG